MAAAAAAAPTVYILHTVLYMHITVRRGTYYI